MSPDALIERAERIGLNGKGMVNLYRAVSKLPLPEATRRLARYDEMLKNKMSSLGVGVMKPEQRALAEQGLNQAWERFNVVQGAVFEMRTGIEIKHVNLRIEAAG